MYVSFLKFLHGIRAGLLLNRGLAGTQVFVVVESWKTSCQRAILWGAALWYRRFLGPRQ